jgi:hypothetical protein
METKRREADRFTDDDPHPSGARSCTEQASATSARFDGRRSRDEVLDAIEGGLRDLAGVEELAVLVPIRSGWMPIWWTGATTPDLAAQAMRGRAGGLRDPIAMLPLSVGDRLIASVVVLALHPSRSCAFDVATVEGFLADAAFALRRAFDAERPTVRPARAR